jgi:hypothetical protein
VEVLWDEISKTEVKACHHEQVVRIAATQDPKDIQLNQATVSWIAVQKAAHALSEASDSVRVNNVRKALEILRSAITELTAYGIPDKTQDGLNILNEFLDRLEKDKGFSAQTVKDAHYSVEFLSRPSTTQKFTTTLPFNLGFTKRLPKINKPKPPEYT